MKDVGPMIYPKKLKEVEGISCPKKYVGYDQTLYDCTICGEAKLYQVCRKLDDRNACAGWIDDKYGPVSCVGYVQIRKEDEKRD